MSSPTTAQRRRPPRPCPARPGWGLAIVLNAPAVAWSYPKRIPLTLYPANHGRPMAVRDPGSRCRIVLEAGIEQVILPGAVDAQIFAGKAFPAKPGLLEQADRGDIARDAGSLDAMQPQRLERERNDKLDRRRHVALAGIG